MHAEKKEHLHDETYGEHGQDPYELDRNHFNKVPDEFLK